MVRNHIHHISMLEPKVKADEEANKKALAEAEKNAEHSKNPEEQKRKIAENTERVLNKPSPQPVVAKELEEKEAEKKAESENKK
jgi:hypothetical protein